MTISNNQNPQNYTLELCFAAEQVTESLQFCFYDQNGDRCEQLADGALASTFNFRQGDRITIKVMGSAGNNPKKDKPPKFDMDIQNCSLVSIPELGVKDISMFDPTNAVTNISGWEQSDPVTDPKTNRVTIEAVSQDKLTVTAKKGQWKISGYLSVTQTYNGKTANKLYYFDPEGSTGGTWGND